ncbi:hypothetical protein BH11PSE10_BH11PSE10_16550 [soil metagenome]
MSDQNDHDKPSATGSAPTLGAKGPNNVSRRRFAKAGAAVPAVLGSLMSKPVLAVTAKEMYGCTMSGKMSGNMSSHPGFDCKTLGRSPSSWKAGTGWPSGTLAGTLNAGMFTKSGTTPGTSFNGFTSIGVLADAFRFKSVSSVCVVYDYSAGSVYSGCPAANKATFLQILNTGTTGDTPLKALGRATVAELLNSLYFAPNYPLTPAQVIAMFNAVYAGGTYKVNATTFWNATQVKTFFESHYA